MKSLSDATAGTLVIASLIAAGVWYAWDSGGQPWPLAYFSAGTTASTAPPPLSVKRLGWSTDGQKLLILFRTENDARGHLALRDLTLTTAPMPIDVMGDTINVATLDPDGRHVLIGSWEGRLWWIDPASLDLAKPLVEVVSRPSFTATAIADSGRVVAGGTDRGSIYLFDPLRQTTIHLKNASESTVGDLRFSRDGKRLVSAQNNGRVNLWDVETEELLQEFTAQDMVTAAELLPDGKRIITAGLDDTLRIWDTVSGQELWRGVFGLFGVQTLAVSLDSTTAAWAGHNHKIIIWDLERGTKRFEIATNAASIYHLAFSPDETTLAVAGREELIRLYDVQTGIERDRIVLDEPQWAVMHDDIKR